MTDPDVLADRHWIAGAKFGWNCALSSDQRDGEHELNAAIEHRLAEIRAFRAKAKKAAPEMKAEMHGENGNG